jgi:hypothetical protein
MSFTCPYCINREKERAETKKGCLLQHFTVNNDLVPRVLFKSECTCGKCGCYDCDATTGSAHHLGCTQELCPLCGEKVIRCKCTLAYPTE